MTQRTMTESRKKIGGGAIALGAFAALFLIAGGADDSPPPERAWRWPSHLTAEQTRELTVVRDRCLDELASLGPGQDERLAEVRVGAGEASAIRQEIEDLSYIQRQGSAHLIRRNRRNHLVGTYGTKAVPFLSEALGSDRYWSARIAAQALRQLGDGPDGAAVSWLTFHFQTPEALAGLFGTGPESEVFGLNLELNATLGVLLDARLAERLDAELELSEPTDIRTSLTQAQQARTAWRVAWRDQDRAWRAEERDRETARRALEDKLALLRKGVNPELAN